MPRKHPGYASRYKCPTCDKNVGHAGRVRFGPFWAHEGCPVTCTLCGQGIDPPQIGQQLSVEVWLNKPAHRACKQGHMMAACLSLPPDPEIEP